MSRNEPVTGDWDSVDLGCISLRLFPPLEIDSARKRRHGDKLREREAGLLRRARARFDLVVHGGMDRLSTSEITLLRFAPKRSPGGIGPIRARRQPRGRIEISEKGQLSGAPSDQRWP